MTSRRRIITPAEAIARARIRPRNAPPVRMRAGMGGWIRWGLIDRDDREVRGGEQHNLLLDDFLEYVATNTEAGGLAGSIWDHPTSLGLPAKAFAYAAVGTGSTEPDASDTGLVSEVTRTNNRIDVSSSRPSAGVYELEITYEFDFAEANGNLTEWGIAHAPSGAMMVRELFRDEVGDPVTVTKTSDYKLRIVYTFRMTFTPTSLTPGSFAITNIGTINGDYLWMGGVGVIEAPDLQVFFAVAAGEVLASATSGYGACAGTGYPTRYPSAYTYSAKYKSASAAIGSPTAGAYTPGVYERAFTSIEVATGVGNQTWEDVAVFQTSPIYSLRNAGFAFAFDVGDRFTKDDLHILTIDNPITVSWGREGSGS